jgi:hypothetical protein
MTPDTNPRATLLTRAVEAWLAARHTPPAVRTTPPARPAVATPAPQGRPTCEDTLCLSAPAAGSNRSRTPAVAAGGCTPEAPAERPAACGTEGALELLLSELLASEQPTTTWTDGPEAPCPPAMRPEPTPEAQPAAQAPAVGGAPVAMPPEEPPLAQLGRRAVNTAINAAVGVAAGGLLGMLAGLASPVLGVAVGLFTVAAVATTGVEWMKRPS